jgi:hypothetical protein
LTQNEFFRYVGFLNRGTNVSDLLYHNCSGQLLHLVVGGDLVQVDPACVQFKDLQQVHFVGAYSNYESAKLAWRGASQASVDNAHRRYFIIHAHRLIDPAHDAAG